MLLILLTACHVFSPIEIECVAGEPCATPDDTGDTADSGDTGETGEPAPSASVGWVALVDGGARGEIGVYDPTGTKVGERRGLIIDPTSKVTIDPTTQAIAVTAPGRIDMYFSDGGTVGYLLDLAPEIYDLDWWQGQYILAAGAYALAIDTEGQQSGLVDGSVPGHDTRSVGVGNPGALVVDLNGGSPDLYTWDGTGWADLAVSDFDTQNARATNVFFGPNDLPHTCSAVGGVYRIEDRPILVNFCSADGGASGCASDISACAWDPVAEAWLLFSPTLGVLRMDNRDRWEVLQSPPSEGTTISVDFYPYPSE